MNKPTVAQALGRKPASASTMLRQWQSKLAQLSSIPEAERADKWAAQVRMAERGINIFAQSVMIDQALDDIVTELSKE